MKKDTRKGDRHSPGYWVKYGKIRRARDKERLLHLSSPKPIPQNTIEKEEK
jgi:hypothetical protein